MYRNGRKQARVRLGRVSWESSGLDGNRFQSILFMETCEFHEKGEDVASTKEAVDLLVLNAQNAWMYAHVCCGVRRVPMSAEKLGKG